MSAPDMRAAALAYAGRGWKVFPCAVGGKAPLFPRRHPREHPCRGECGRVGHGYLDATTDPEVITRWWRQHPRANVGVAAGAPGPDVLDVDVKAAGDGYGALARLRDAGLLAGATAMVATPSGGRHVYYLGTDQRKRALPRHHLDLQARGAYVVVPPSQVDGRSYELLDERPEGAPLDFARVIALLQPRRSPTPAAARREGDKTGGIAGLADWVARQTEGNRDNGLFWAACRALEDGHDGDLDQLVAAAMRAGQTEREARRAVASARRHVGAAL